MQQMLGANKFQSGSLTQKQHHAISKEFLMSFLLDDLLKKQKDNFAVCLKDNLMNTIIKAEQYAAQLPEDHEIRKDLTACRQLIDGDCQIGELLKIAKLLAYSCAFSRSERLNLIRHLEPQLYELFMRGPLL